MKTVILSFVGLLLAVASVNTASAQATKLKSLTATDMGNSLQICYDVAGLGNVSQTKLTITYSAVVTTECTNPAGNVAPGQTKTLNNQSVNIMVSVNNGRAVGCETIGGFTPGSCPNSQWTSAVKDVSFSNVSISIGGKTFRTSVQ
jgi:hypothetical protein